jgi:hypothetical protein
VFVARRSANPDQQFLFEREPNLAPLRGWILHFQDAEAYGRIVHMQPVAWKTTGRSSAPMTMVTGLGNRVGRGRSRALAAPKMTHRAADAHSVRRYRLQYEVTPGSIVSPSFASSAASASIR